MSYFNADEAFEVAEQIERNGAQFYRTAADSITDADKKKVLINLAEMEDEHEITFKNLRKELSKKDKSVTVFDPENESVQYLKALADTHVFYKKEYSTNSLKEIFQSALQAEKDTIIFFLGLQDSVPQQFGKDKLDKIIEEEKGHIRIISKEMQSI